MQVLLMQYARILLLSLSIMGSSQTRRRIFFVVLARRVRSVATLLPLNEVSLENKALEERSRLSTSGSVPVTHPIQELYFVSNGVKCAGRLCLRRRRRAGRRLLLHGDVQTLTFDPPRVGADVWLVKVDLIHFPYEVELI